MKLRRPGRDRTTLPSARLVEAAPRRHPVSTFAGILDGHTLWLAVDARPGALALRETSSGDVVALPSDRLDDQPAYTAVRVDLDHLPAEVGSTYDVVMVPSGGGSTTGVWTPPLDDARPTTAPDGHTRFGLDRDEDGMLRVTRAPAEPAAELHHLAVVVDAVRLTVTGAPGATLALLDDDDCVTASCDGDLDGDRLTVTLTADRLTAGAGRTARVVVGTAGSWLPVRRRASTVSDLVRGVPLPELPGLRLQWSPAALLLVAA